MRVHIDEANFAYDVVANAVCYFRIGVFV